MPQTEPTAELNEGFSEPGAAARPWAEVADVLSKSNPRCILTTGTSQLRSGLDVVVEGTAVRVTGTAQLRRLAAMWKSKLDWDFEVTGEVFGDADGRQGLVFGVTPVKVLSFGKSPYTQTRYSFNHGTTT
jgi:hypothetical protein